MTRVNFSIMRTQNVGDLYCQPARYFPELKAELADINDPAFLLDVAIFGGGALGRRFYRRHHKRFGARVSIAWGVGTSVHGQKEVPAAPEGFALYGSRDDGQQGAVWVPCASCMSPLFDRKYAAAHDTVVYYNKDSRFDRPNLKGLPVQHNEITFEEAIAFLASGEKVVTNSYHGAYWAMLLGRKVILAAPYSSKFHHYRHMPDISEDASWLPALSMKGRMDAGALEECRTANRFFLKRVRERLAEGG